VIAHPDQPYIMVEVPNKKGLCLVTFSLIFRPLSLVSTILVAAGLLAPVTGHAENSGEPTRLHLVVSILPQAWFAEQIGGDGVDVSVLVGPGQSPATFDPSARQMANLLEAELFVTAGVPFERGLLPKITRLPRRPIIVGVPVPEAAGRVSSEASHGHDHGGLDPHTWLDPTQAQALADTMCAAMCRLRPQSRSEFQSRREILRDTLDDLDQTIGEMLAPFSGREFYVFHPAFGHFGAAYRLIQVAIETDGHEPGARHLADVIGRAKASGATAIIVQPQFSRKSAESVARSLAVEVIALDPLAREYDANLLEIARTLKAHFAAAHESHEGHSHGEHTP
jgi:zinc transport system substrate-binding protein